MKFFIVDTFSKIHLSGTPASVFFADNFADEDLMRRIATEIKVPETVFVKKQSSGNFEIAVFTPTAKGLFFGNGLFAAAKAINHEFGATRFNIVFEANAFATEVLDNGEIQVQFPVMEFEKVPMPLNLDTALAGELVVSLTECQGELITEIRSPNRLSNLQPNLGMLAAMEYNSIVLTADTHFETDLDYDFCLKVFAPKLGLFHSVATPMSCAKLAVYWSQRMDKTELVASGCNGEMLRAKVETDKVLVSGDATITATGEMTGS
jgi:predicted PhzF superfamily epimerase YddE/YHI9